MSLKIGGTWDVQGEREGSKGVERPMPVKSRVGKCRSVLFNAARTAVHCDRLAIYILVEDGNTRPRNTV